MALTIFNNLINRIKRRKTQASFTHKIKNQQQKARTNSVIKGNYSNNKIFKFLPSINFNFRLIIIILLILSTAVCSVHFYRIADAWIKFQPEKFEQEGMVSSYKWNGKDKLTILIVGTDQVTEDHVFIDALGIYSIDPINNAIAVFMINPDLKVYMSAIGKDINFRTMLHDKNIEGDKINILKNAVSTLLAVKVDKYVVIEKSAAIKLLTELNPIKVSIAATVNDKDITRLTGGQEISWEAGSDKLIWGSELIPFMASDNNGRDDQLLRQQNVIVALPYYQNSVRTFVKLPEIINLVAESIFTDLEKQEILTISQALLNTKEKEIKKGYTRQSSYNKTKSISFYDVFTPDLTQIDKDINNIFFDMQIFKEQAKIEILNSSQIRGLANNRARWIVNTGGRVVKVGNGFSAAEITKIYCAEPGKYPYTILELSRIFNNKAEFVNSKFPNRHVGDIVVELGDLYE